MYLERRKRTIRKILMNPGTLHTPGLRYKYEQDLERHKRLAREFFAATPGGINVARVRGSHDALVNRGGIA